jgi:Kef-type K+ transport system membrane component KefB
MVAAVAAPLLGAIPLGFKIPVVVFEVLLGILIGPYVFGLVHFDGFVATMFTIASATVLFMAGMGFDFGLIKGPSVGASGWRLSWSHLRWPADRIHVPGRGYAGLFEP